MTLQSEIKTLLYSAEPCALGGIRGQSGDGEEGVDPLTVLEATSLR